MFKRGTLCKLSYMGFREPARDANHNILQKYVETPEGTIVEIIEPLKGWSQEGYHSAYLIWVPSKNEYIGCLTIYLRKFNGEK